MMERAFAAVGEALDAGELVAIFPEGRLTPDGEMGGFRPGVRRILDRNPVPVVPMALRGLWGSVFSRHPGRGLGRFGIGLFPHIEIAVGARVPATEVRLDELREQVMALRGARR